MSKRWIVLGAGLLLTAMAQPALADGGFAFSFRAGRDCGPRYYAPAYHTVRYAAPRYSYVAPGYYPRAVRYDCSPYYRTYTRSYHYAGPVYRSYGNYRVRRGCW